MLEWFKFFFGDLRTLLIGIIIAMIVGCALMFLILKLGPIILRWLG